MARSKTPRTLKDIAADHRVALVEVADDDTFGTGRPSYWAHLRPGFIDPEYGTHSIHEPTVRDLARKLCSVVVEPENDRSRFIAGSSRA